MDDTFMTEVFSGNTTATEYLLKVILTKPDLKVLHAVTQLPIANIQGKSIRLDIYAMDADGKHYNIEIQQRNDGAVPERARLNSALFDAMLTKSGQKYTAIPETFVIFITENDVLGYGLPIYNIERTIQQNHQLFNDKEHIVYVNGAYREDDAIGQLMHDFHCTDYRAMHNKALASAVYYYKETPEGVDKMCEAMDRISARRAEEAVLEDRYETARLLWDNGEHDYDKISKIARLTLEQVREALSIQSA